MKSFARFISVIGHPMLTIPLFILVVLLGGNATANNLLLSFLIVGCVFIPIILWMYIKAKTGSITNFDVSDRIQRKSLFWFAIPLLIAVTIILFVTKQPKAICLSVLFALILLVISQIVNQFIKSSLHVSLNIFLSALMLPLNPLLSLMVFLFSGLLAWSRVRLGRHTKMEVLVGFVTGTILSLFMLFLQGFLEF